MQKESIGDDEATPEGGDAGAQWAAINCHQTDGIEPDEHKWNKEKVQIRS